MSKNLIKNTGDPKQDRIFLSKVVKKLESEATLSKSSELSISSAKIFGFGVKKKECYFSTGIIADQNLKCRRSRSVKKILKNITVFQHCSLNCVYYFAVSENFFYIFYIK